MKSDIKFGTDGWRAITDKVFTEENVRIAVLAIAKYVYEDFGADKKIIIGYDPRRKADFFAKESAEILKGLGFEVLISDRVIPTPVLAFQAKELHACALMFTASHNPPEYLGLKFIPDYAGPATSEITDKITANLGAEIKPFRPNGSIKVVDFAPAYFKHLETLIDFDKIKSHAGKIIFDGLYSATIGYFDKFLETHGIKFESLHLHHDVNFGGGMPEPKPKYLTELIGLCKCAVGFANDGDGDRFGVINENGEYVTPNEIIAILLIHLKKHKNYKGALVKTVGASLMLNILAEKLGVELIETAVGFKHVGEAMRKFNPIIAGEESGGLSIQNHIPEKDGILANLLVLEAMAYENKTLVELQKDLKAFIGKEFINDRVDKHLENFDEVKPFLEKVKALCALGNLKVSKTDLTDGVKLFFEDGESWILARPSGTEPLLRIYFETTTNEKMNFLQNEMAKI